MSKQEQSETEYLARVEPLLKKDMKLKLAKPPEETKQEREQRLVNSAIYHHMYETEPPDKHMLLNKNAERSRQIKLKFQRQELEWLRLMDRQLQTFRSNISNLEKAQSQQEQHLQSHKKKKHETAKPNQRMGDHIDS